MHRLLKELNPSVEGCSRQAVCHLQAYGYSFRRSLTSPFQNPAQLLKDEPEFFLSFTMILSVNSAPEFDLALSDLLWSSKLESSKTGLVLTICASFGISFQQ